MSCPNPLKNITKICDVALGFKSKIYVAREDEVEAIPAAVDGVISSAMTMVSTPAAGKFYFMAISKDLGKSQWNAVTEGAYENSVFKITGEVFIAGMSGDASASLSGTRGQEFIIVIEDKDNKKWLFGAKDDGCIIKIEATSSGDTKGYKLTWEVSSKVLPLEYSSTLDIAA